ncbi:uncharacterized protein LOC132198427 [Neocloeon triangulifer]|uniref:uncharacterized protein LOC132198427 n=1 Tax=Neocloeon triangulifer TaxID=2078957 RepID=UPI00286EC633|nr:uncharacterized protein LOC132198427 [Neocloeon triangulifer]
MGCKPSKSPGKMVLYYDKRSAPCRTVMLTAAALDLKLQLEHVDLQKGEHMKPKFLDMNPQHCIPTFKDGDFILWESRAIAQYLMNQYATDDSLYPKDPRRRALVDARLNFDQGFLYQRLLNYYVKLFFQKTHDQELLDKVIEALEMLDKFLDGKLWAAGDTMTIADFALVASVSTAEFFSDKINLDKTPHVAKWLARCKANIKGYEEHNQDGVNALKEVMSKMSTGGNLVLYYDERSSPCRTVMLTAAALGLKPEMKRFDLLKNETTADPEFLKINPQHCVPTLKDGNFVLWESRAIAQYLVNQYGANDSLYPKDPKKRALVDARLFFDLDRLYPNLSHYFTKLFYQKTRDEELLKKGHEALELLNTFLEGNMWVAGDSMTIADLCIITTVSATELLEELSVAKYENVTKWLERCKSTIKGYAEHNQPGIDALKDAMAKGI